MPFENPLEEAMGSAKLLDPCVLVIFGATGDLTARKLVPAIYNLSREGQLPTQFACVGFARRPKEHDQFRAEMEEAVNRFSRVRPVDPGVWRNFSQQLFYHQSEFDNDEGYAALKTYLEELDRQLGTRGNRVFYLATQPRYFPLITEKLNIHGLVYNEGEVKDQWSRVIIEKPFGHDHDSAIELQRHISRFLSEDQTYRIDHYLGKETVQNLLVFRFANAIFEPLWNNKHIDHVQITVAEEQGIGTRGRLWEEQGLLRDIVQNHLMQLLSLMAMEPPVNFDANSIRDEKVKVLQALRQFRSEALHTSVVRGQYGPGYCDGEPAKGYREEDNVSPTSMVESFAAFRLHIDNWRWAGVPFFVRAGKRLPKRVTEIAITFKEIPGYLFRRRGQRPETNVLVMQIQPDEGIALRVNCKVPGLAHPTIQPVKMDFRYGSYFGFTSPEAYERLICDCIGGDSTLFARDDEVLASWRLFTPVLNAWKEETDVDFPNYQAGTWGPQTADELIGRTGRAWRFL